jgi:hypothetical protein
MRSILVLTIITLLPVAAEAQVIDQDYRKAEQAMKQEVSTSCGGLNPIKQNICFKKIYGNYKASGQLRGTGEYIRKHFSDAPVTELDNEIRKRNSLFRQIRSEFADNRQVGELTSSAMEIEVSELRALINEKGGMPGGRRR